jgi:hypothetical protein
LLPFEVLLGFINKFYHKSYFLSIFEFFVEKIFLFLYVNPNHNEPKVVAIYDPCTILVARIRLTLCIRLVIIFSGFADTTLADKSAKIYERKLKNEKRIFKSTLIRHHTCYVSHAWNGMRKEEQRQRFA